MTDSCSCFRPRDKVAPTLTGRTLTSNNCLANDQNVPTINPVASINHLIRYKRWVKPHGLSLGGLMCWPSNVVWISLENFTFVRFLVQDTTTRIPKNYEYCPLRAMTRFPITPFLGLYRMAFDTKFWMTRRAVHFLLLKTTASGRTRAQVMANLKAFMLAANSWIIRLTTRA